MFPAKSVPDRLKSSALFCLHKFQSMDYNTKTPTTASWNLSIQRQVGSDWILSASYIGNETAHVWAQKPGNPAVFLGLGPCTINGVSYNRVRRLLTQINAGSSAYRDHRTASLIGYLGLLDPGANVSYQAMLLSVQHRFSKNFTLQSNYTWSHCNRQHLRRSDFGRSGRHGNLFQSQQPECGSRTLLRQIGGTY